MLGGARSGGGGGGGGKSRAVFVSSSIEVPGGVGSSLLWFCPKFAAVLDWFSDLDLFLKPKLKRIVP